MAITRFEDIESWQLGRRLTVAIYAIWDSGAVPRDFALRDQMVRAAGSVMHNIAECFEAGTNTEFLRFLSYSKRSCAEVQSQLYVALDRGYLDQIRFDELYGLCDKTRAKIGAFVRYLSQHAKVRKGDSINPSAER